MKVAIKPGDPLERVSDALILPVKSIGDAIAEDVTVDQVDNLLNGELKPLIADSKFSGKPGRALVAATLGKAPFRRIVLTGIGSADTPLTAETLRIAWGAGITAAASAGATDVTSAIPAPIDGNVSDSVAAATAGADLSMYKFDGYRGAVSQTKTDKTATTLTFVGDAPAKAVATGLALAAGVTLARNLCSEPASTLNPERMAEIAAKVATENKLEITVFDVAGLTQLGANAILTVGRGSSSPPRLIHLVYKPGKGKLDEKPVGIIGKCITFDTGGYSLKPYEGMLEMKGDMAGGAAVLGAMAALRPLGCKREVHAVICAAENMVSGDAFRPGDIITGMNGVTMEILSTDAEGRLVLADGLVYTSRQGVGEMIDLATLTGAKVVALGDETTGLFANDDRLAGDLLAASERAGESMWRLPLSKHLHDQIKGEVGDIKNTGGRSGGAITAALFIEHFSEALPWAHLDIAGGNRTTKPRPYTPKGSTGIGVRTLLEYLLR